MSDLDVRPYAKLSDGVVEQLNSASYEGTLRLGPGGTANATRGTLPSFDTKSLQTVQVVVGPVNRSRERIGRGVTQLTLNIAVHVVKICKTEAAHDEVESLASEIELVLLERVPQIVGYTCMRMEVEQVLDAEQLIDNQAHWERLTLVYR